MAEAEDALQDFYLKMVRHKHELEYAGNVEAWIRQVLRNTLIDQYRRRDARRRGLAALSREARATATDPNDEAAETVCMCLHHLLPTLKPDYADILRRADLRGQKRDQIASDLGLSATNVSVRLHRARRALKRRLEQACHTCPQESFLDCRCAPKAEDSPATAKSAGHLRGGTV